MKESGVYKITNTVNGKIYIGSSIDVERRIRQHTWKLKHGTHKNRHLQYAYNKYGAENFIIEIIEFCEAEKCIEREQFYLDFYTPFNIENGYNIRTIAESQLGIKFSEESIKKLSESHKGYKPTLQARKNQSSAMMGRKVSDETREKLRAKNIGKKMSKEACAKISVALTKRKGKMSDFQKSQLKIGRDKFNENHPDIIKFNQYTKDGEFIMEHKSMKAAAIHIKGIPSHVWRVVHGLRKTTRGFIFKTA